MSVVLQRHPVQRSLWGRGCRAVQDGVRYGPRRHRVEAGAQSLQERAIKVLAQDKGGGERADPAWDRLRQRVQADCLRFAARK
jgi:hypothetical protein